MGEPVKLTKAQREMLAFYAANGPTTQRFGRIRVWDALVSKGLLWRSYGLGPIAADITPAGHVALTQEDGRG